jgi:cytochrome c
VEKKNMTNSSAVPVGLILLSLLLSGCGSGGDKQQATEGSESASASQVDIYALLANADVERGKMMYLQCRACHSLEQGGAHKVGPNLHGMFGSEAGFAAGFAYSEPMTNSEVVWSPETLDPWLERPSQFMPGTRMVFAGVRNPQDRANLIAYLLSQTAPDAN